MSLRSCGLLVSFLTWHPRSKPNDRRRSDRRDFRHRGADRSACRDRRALPEVHSGVQDRHRWWSGAAVDHDPRPVRDQVRPRHSDRSPWCSAGSCRSDRTSARCSRRTSAIGAAEARRAAADWQDRPSPGCRCADEADVTRRPFGTSVHCPSFARLPCFAASGLRREIGCLWPLAIAFWWPTMNGVGTLKERSHGTHRGADRQAGRNQLPSSASRISSRLWKTSTRRWWAQFRASASGWPSARPPASG